MTTTLYIEWQRAIDQLLDTLEELRSDSYLEGGAAETRIDADLRIAQSLSLCMLAAASVNQGDSA